MKRKPAWLIALLASALVFPAFAGNSLNLTSRPAKPAGPNVIISSPERTNPLSKGAVRDGFEPAAGEAGWQLSQHRYVLKDGKLEHGDECDHVIRSASAASPADIERARAQSPGS